MQLLLLMAALLAAGKPSLPVGVDWPAGVLRARGEGPPDLKAANPAQARLAAEKAAQLDAQRRLLSIARSVSVRPGKSVSDLMADSDELRARVEDALRDFHVVAKHHFSDSGVEVEVELPLARLNVLLPDPSVTGELKPGSGKFSSLILDASAQNPPPALSPRVLDAGGGALFSVDRVAAAARAEGVVHYARTLEDARRSPWAGEHPLILKAAGVQGPDVALSAADARALLQAAECLREGRVIIVSPAL